MALVEYAVDISFGDCDPAGIVFYPNYLRWMDATFHKLPQQQAGGHARLCERFAAMGIGVMEISLKFRSPATERQRILYRIMEIDWGNRSFAIRYEADVDGRLVLEGTETRGIFVIKSGRMAAAEVEGLRQALEIVSRA